MPLLVTELANQDPYRRIGFEPALMVLAKGGPERLLEETFPDMISATPYLIPFWTLTFIFHTTRWYQHRQTGNPPIGNPTRMYRCHVGFAIAAVHKDHWCSGLVLQEDVDFLSIKQRAPATSMSHSPACYIPQPLSPPLFDPIWDPETAPMFACAPPILTEGEASRFLNLQSIGDDEYITRYKVESPYEMYAIPTYRLAYEVMTHTGKSFLDSQLGEVFSIKSSAERAASDSLSCMKEVTRLAHKRLQKEDDNQDPATIGQVVGFWYPEGRSAEAIDIILAAMQRNKTPMATASWENGRIMSALMDYKHDMYTVSSYADSRSRGIVLDSPWYPTQKQPTHPSSRPPQASPLRPSARLGASRSTTSTSPLNQPNARTQPHSQARPQAKVRSTRIRIRPVPQSPALRDVKGHYRTLGLALTIDNLDPQKETEINKLVKQRFLALSIKSDHPDRLGLLSEVSFNAIREAQEQLGTLKARQEYSVLKEVNHVTK
ncbi:hypothetical protein M231_03623 [Tremella mesenterica]|uniref:Uncharacterized protein n=1 Tax=Tremella mesenterica TaxID=5217 RepID=A0A4Q1BMQ0_TREME|nr:hypothetical protein M231_03623 [Tremella mesenterica]